MPKKKDRWECEPDYIWMVENGSIVPSPYFLKWWQDVSIIKYGDNSHWLDIAVELGYVSKEIDPISQKVIYEPVGFDYDPALVRNSLGLSQDMPIIRHSESGQEAYQHLIQKLLINGD